MKYFFGIILVLSTRLLFGQAFEQDKTTNDFFTQIKDYDLSVVWTADSIADEEEIFERAPILGFIGDDYQRLHIRFISIIQNPLNPYEYFTYGKTKVKENICSFQGTIKVTKSRLYKETDMPDWLPNYKQGYVECELNLYEDRKEKSTGLFSGKLKTNFIIDDKGKLKYDAINSVADGFYNNQFVGTWTSYNTKSTKKTHWGDYRIPESGDLDCGTGLFMVWDKYQKNGWQSYVKCNHRSYPDMESYQKACEEEFFEWWK